MNNTATIEEASTTLPVTIFADRLGGFVATREAELACFRRDLLDGELSRLCFYRSVDQRQQFALQGSMIALGAHPQTVDLVGENVLDGNILRALPNLLRNGAELAAARQGASASEASAVRMERSQETIAATT